MKSFLINIESAIDLEQEETLSPESAPTDPPTRLPSTESEYSWIRKTVFEELELLKDDILDADNKIDDYVEQTLGKNQESQKYVLIFESFLDNKSIIQRINLLGWTPIIVRNQKRPPSCIGGQKEALEGGKKQLKMLKSKQRKEVKEILINEISSYLHRCHSVIICSDSITKTGGVLSVSGSMMLCMMARRRHIPVIVVSRNYCLIEKILLSQKSLTTSVNPTTFFKIDHNDFGLYITKEEDYIDRKYIDLMITERGSWMVDDISQVQDNYWSY